MRTGFELVKASSFQAGGLIYIVSKLDG
jgi:hypothetical protein